MFKVKFEKMVEYLFSKSFSDKLKGVMTNYGQFALWGCKWGLRGSGLVWGSLGLAMGLWLDFRGFEESR
jgi:hypothetical protein